jgi:multisubunit Na+/H+ antiporter MnhG subunit
MLIWLGAALFVATGAALVRAREPLARALALTLGARLGAGCIVAIAIAFFVMAVAVVAFRDWL